MSDSDDDAPEEVTLNAGKEAVIATRKQENTGRKQVNDAAKRKAAEKATVADEKNKKAKKAKPAAAAAADAAAAEDEDDEVEELDLDVINAVAARPVGGDAGGGAASGAGAAREKITKKAARRAAKRLAEQAAEEGYAGGGVWERDGFNVVVAGDAHERRPVGTGPAMDFLAGKLMVNGFFKAMIDTQHANVDGGS